MLVQGATGAVNKYADGVAPPQGVRQGNQGEVMVSELHGRYYEQSYRRNLFTAANAALVTTSVGLATTATGLILSNPIGNLVNLSLLKVGWAMAVAPAAAYFIGLAQGYSASTNVVHTTPVAPAAGLYGIAVPTAKTDTAATLPLAPNYQLVLGGGGAAVYTGPSIYDLEGSLILPPGGFAIIATSVASGAAGFAGSFMWEEIPI